MTLLSEIEDGAVGNSALSGLLRQAMVLATRLDHEPLRQWVAWELDGYPSPEALPDYRCGGTAHVQGDFSGPFGSGLRNAVIPPAVIKDKEMKRILFELHFMSGVATFENLLASGEATFKEQWPGDALVLYGQDIYQGQSLMSAWKVVPAAGIAGVLDAVRNKLLAFALEIGREDPQAGEASSTAQPLAPARISQIFNVTISGGSTNLVAGSGDVQQSVNLELGVGWSRLREQLIEQEVPEPEIGALEAALTADRRAGHLSEPGPETQQWLDRLSSGAVQVGTGGAAGVISGLVLKFLGVA